jgi:hypothetical protein
MATIQLFSIRPIAIRTALLSLSLVTAISTPIFTLQTAAHAASFIDISSSHLIASAPQLVDRRGCSAPSISSDSIDVPNIIPTASGCYEFWLNGRFVSIHKGWSLQQAIANLEQQKIAHPHDQVEGYFSSFKIGYELYWDGVRVGYEPGWTLEQAIANLEWNQATYPEKQIEGYFYGLEMDDEL